MGGWRVAVPGEVFSLEVGPNLCGYDGHEGAEIDGVEVCLGVCDEDVNVCGEEDESAFASAPAGFEPGVWAEGGGVRVGV